MQLAAGAAHMVQQELGTGGGTQLHPQLLHQGALILKLQAAWHTWLSTHASCSVRLHWLHFPPIAPHLGRVAIGRVQLGTQPKHVWRKAGAWDVRAWTLGDERGVNTSTPRLGRFRLAWAMHNVWRGGAATMTLRAPSLSSTAVLSLLLACCASHLARGITGDGAASSRWHAVSRAPLDVWILAGCAASQALALLSRQAVFLSVHEGLTSQPPFFAAQRRVKQGSYASLFVLCNLHCEQPLQLSPEHRACLPAQPPP